MTHPREIADEKRLIGINDSPLFVGLDCPIIMFARTSIILNDGTIWTFRELLFLLTTHR